MIWPRTLVVGSATIIALVAAMFTAPGGAQAQGLVGGYAFDETSGTSAADISGNGNTGALTNGAVFAAGKNGNAVSLDGVNDFVSLGNGPSLQLIGSMTISAWINAAGFPVDDAVVVSKRTGSPFGFQLDTNVDTGPRVIGFKLTNAAGTNMFRYGTTVLQLNTWYHVAGVYDATAQTLTVYLNGQIDNGTLVGTVTTSQQNSTLNVNVGQRSGIPNTYNFRGRIDDVRIYNRALAQAEIQNDMATPVGGLPLPNTPPMISSIADQLAAEDTATANLAFTVGDAETAPGSLGVSGTSSNTALVPNANIVFGGSGANRTVTVMPAANQTGVTTITVAVNDGQATTTTSFQVTVTAVNDAPTVSTIANQVTSPGVAVGPLGFTVGDPDTPVTSLTVSGTSSNTPLVPNANITFGGSGANRPVPVEPARSPTGIDTLPVAVNGST